MWPVEWHQAPRSPLTARGASVVTELWFCPGGRVSQSRSGVPGPRDPPAPQVPSLVMVTRTASDTRQQAQEWPRSGECPLTTLQSLCIPVSDHNTGLFIISSGVSVMCQPGQGWCNPDILPRNNPLPATTHAILCFASREFYWAVG